MTYYWKYILCAMQIIFFMRNVCLTVITIGVELMKYYRKITEKIVSYCFE